MSSNLEAQSPPIWRRILIYAAVATLPVSVNWGKLQTPPQKPFYITAFDFLLPLLAILMLIDLLQRKPWARFKLPPVPAILWVLWALATLFWIQTGSTKEFLVTWAKGPVFFGVVATWVFSNVSTDREELRRLMLLLVASVAVGIGVAMKQYFGPVGLPFNPVQPTMELGGASDIRVAGWYEFRGVFGAQMALIIPTAAAFAIADESIGVRIFGALVAVAGLCVTLAAGGMIGAVAGIVVVLALYGTLRRDWIGALIGLFVLCGVLWALLPLLPRNNAAILQRGVAHFALNEGQLAPTARLRRYQAVIDLLGAPSNPFDPQSKANWRKGVGLGKYQERVNQFYQAPYEKPGRATDDEAQFDMNADEPFTFGLLESVIVELGVPGLLIFLFLFGCWLSAGFGACAATLRQQRMPSAPALAALGAGVGALIFSVFANPLVRAGGAGGMFAFFFALSWLLWHLESTGEQA